MVIESWHFYLMAMLYLTAGITHFLKSKWYLYVMPPGIPHKLLVVYLSGIVEIYLALLLLMPYWKKMALLGIILMLILFLPVHIYMLTGKQFQKRFPKWALWLRLPLQGLLIFWAWMYY